MHETPARERRQAAQLGQPVPKHHTNSPAAPLPPLPPLQSKPYVVLDMTSSGGKNLIMEAHKKVVDYHISINASIPEPYASTYPSQVSTQQPLTRRPPRHALRPQSDGAPQLSNRQRFPMPRTVLHPHNIACYAASITVTLTPMPHPHASSSPAPPGSYRPFLTPPASPLPPHPGLSPPLPQAVVVVWDPQIQWTGGAWHSYKNGIYGSQVSTNYTDPRNAVPVASIKPFAGENVWVANEAFSAVQGWAEGSLIMGESRRNPACSCCCDRSVTGDVTAVHDTVCGGLVMGLGVVALGLSCAGTYAIPACCTGRC